MSNSMNILKRTHYCGRLREDNISEQVTVSGWVQRRRDLGGVIFIDLRDKTGIVQIVIDSKDVSDDAFIKAESLRNEFVVAIQGVIEKRGEETINNNIPTGTIDVRSRKINVLNASKTPPFMIGESVDSKEDLRMTYRYLDLRRKEMFDNLYLRQQIISSVREYLISDEFLEVETPIFTKSTPEGARDYLVPSRVSKGTFYALPQSPQIYKQLLMVSGVDKYFQVARCFRDEDLRADRQPEFTQVDMELSFVDQHDIIAMLEKLFTKIFKETKGIDVKFPFRRITYDDAMDKYGFDKPDLRFGMEMIDLTDILATSSFEVFRKVVDSGGIVKGLCIKNGNDLTRTQIEQLTEKSVSLGGKGMAWIAIEPNGNIRSVLTKFFTEEDMKKILNRLEAKPGDMVIFSADKKDKVRNILGSLRLELGDMLEVRDSNKYEFVVVTDFPLLEWSEENKRFVAMHHPFTMPNDEDLHLLDTDPGKIRAKSYDIVLNGVELGSGSIRIHKSDIQEKMFKLLGFTHEEAIERFGFLLKAFEYGTPPHGGFAFGLDRLAMIMAGGKSIRDVIAFPKMKDASCAMMQTPSKVSGEQLMELDLHVALAEIAEEEKTSKISDEMLSYVANLARLNIEDDEKEELTKNLEDIIAFADKLNDVKIDDVDPLAYIIDNKNVLRNDEVKPSLEIKEAIKNAKETKNNMFYVPKSL